MGTGATFSPPAVMSNSFFRPVELEKKAMIKTNIFYLMPILFSDEFHR